MLAALTAGAGLVLPMQVATAEETVTVSEDASNPGKDPALFSVGLSFFDRFRKRDHQPELRLEYRGEKVLSHFKPYYAAAATYCMGEHFTFCPGKKTTWNAFLGGGLMLDIYFGRRVVVTPSFGVNLYGGGSEDLDLDYPLIFREQLEIAYRFDDYSRLGVAVTRYENLGLGDTNPGAEGIGLYYSMPFDDQFGK